ncbi:MAG: biotin--[acetyl-CoA-carboxylase] ligase [Solirubrobacteraceae bacterium]|nr:biotin--[acetyl-CoA-carboxylase] ligase [Solirubrobacteraceae bacterium]
MSGPLGRPRLHHRVTDSTSLVARTLAAAGAPHGTLVTAGEQRAGRGRQGRTWSAPPGRALLMSLVLREWPPLVPVVGALAVADVAARVAGAQAVAIKWPNDVLLGGRKLAGVLGEGRTHEGWAVLGIGLNVAVRVADLPPELHDRAATLGLDPAAIEPTLEALLRALEQRLAQPTGEVLDALRARDALRGRRVRWAKGEGVGCGIDDAGRLLVDTGDGDPIALEAGEVHLLPGT